MKRSLRNKQEFTHQLSINGKNAIGETKSSSGESNGITTLA